MDIWFFLLYINCLALVSQAEALKEENDSLRWQLDAYRNEVELLKQEQGKAHREDDPNKEQQLKLLQQALQGMQQVKAFWFSELFGRLVISSSPVKGPPEANRIVNLFFLIFCFLAWLRKGLHIVVHVIFGKYRENNGSPVSKDCVFSKTYLAIKLH